MDGSAATAGEADQAVLHATFLFGSGGDADFGEASEAAYSAVYEAAFRKLELPAEEGEEAAFVGAPPLAAPGRLPQAAARVRADEAEQRLVRAQAGHGGHHQELADGGGPRGFLPRAVWPSRIALSRLAAGRGGFPVLSARPPASGYFRSGLPYNRLGHGSRPLVVVQGLLFENKPQPRYSLGPYAFLRERYTVFVVLRRPGMPRGYTLADMAADCAATIREEFGGPVDVIGVSTGGSIVQHLAADHPDVVRRLVIHSSAYTLSPSAKRLQLRVGELARERRWKEASTLLVDAVVPPRLTGRARKLVVASIARMMSWSSRSADPSRDLIVTIAAEDAHDFRDRLAEIAAPTLVIAGADDPFYTEELFHETAAGIPGGRLILYRAWDTPRTGSSSPATCRVHSAQRPRGSGRQRAGRKPPGCHRPRSAETRSGGSRLPCADLPLQALEQLLEPFHALGDARFHAGLDHRVAVFDGRNAELVVT